jgi:CheY-like chemotaxis protein
MRRYVTGLLAPHCEVHAVRDGQEGWDEMHKTNWDLVLSDAMMPRMTGFELLEHLRQDPAYNQIPFIILSARAGDDARLEGLSKGADGRLSTYVQFTNS